MTKPAPSLFEQITTLPEYYLTRTERAIFDRPRRRASSSSSGSPAHRPRTRRRHRHQDRHPPPRPHPPPARRPLPAHRHQPHRPRRSPQHLDADIPGLTVRPQVANYITEPIRIHREPGTHTPRPLHRLQHRQLLSRRSPRHPHATSAPSSAPATPSSSAPTSPPARRKTVAALLAAYDDAAGITAAFNRNILARLNRDLGANFDLDCFPHRARWNPTESRIEMHLVSTVHQTVQHPRQLRRPRPHPPLRPRRNHPHRKQLQIHPRRHRRPPHRLRASPPPAPSHDPHHLFAVTLATAV